MDRGWGKVVSSSVAFAVFAVGALWHPSEAASTGAPLPLGVRGTVSEQEPNNTCPGQAIACGDIVDPAQFTSAGDVDWYHFTAAAGTVVTIWTDASDGGNPDAPATEITLVGPDCATVLASDLDSGPGLFSLIQNVTLPATGTYSVRANTWNGSGYYKLCLVCGAQPVGACCLSGSLCEILSPSMCGAGGGAYLGDNVACNPLPCPIPPTNDLCSGALPLLRCSSGNLDGTTIYATDNYWNSVGCVGVADHGRDVTYRIDLLAGDHLGVLYWPLSMDGGIYLVRDCNNVGASCVAGADVNLWGQPETFQYTVVQSGTYYLICDAYDWNAGGPYALNYSITCSAATVGDGLGATGGALLTATPNPFGPSTRIHYRLDASGPVRMEIFDASGRLIRRLVDESAGAGEQSLKWDRRDDQGRRVASGTYYCRLSAGSAVRTQVLVALE